MMDTIIFGPEDPKIDLTADPEEGSIQYSIRNENVLTFNSEQPVITWLDLGYGAMKRINDRVIEERKPRHPLTPAERARHVLSQAKEEAENREERRKMESQTLDLFEDLYYHLEGMVGSPYEAKLLRLYVEERFSMAGPLEELLNLDHERDDSEYRMNVVWNSPALIPQVWVNWIHHDPEDKERAQTRQQEPFRVDFLLVDDRLSEQPTIIEVDGMTHFGYWGTNEAGEPSFEPSLEDYTEHLRKDRWLRNQGWNVVRISNQEVEELEEEIRGSGDSPSVRSFLYDAAGSPPPGASGGNVVF